MRTIEKKTPTAAKATITANSTGTIKVALFDDKKELDRQATAAGTTGTNLARILIRDGLAKLASGEFKITMTVAPIELDDDDPQVIFNQWVAQVEAS